MRRKILLVVAMTALALGGGVATADTADARRNVGGTVPADAICLSPGQSQARSDQANDVLLCFCYILPPPAPAPGDRNVGGNEPAGETTCPPGILKQEARPDRNVGG